MNAADVCRALRGLPLVATLAAAFLPPALAADAPRPRIGLALSGGGARGAAHVGVLKVLEEHRVPVDLVAGTSMGALVGGLYASGLSPAELEAVLQDTDWALMFADNIPRADRSFRRKRDDDLYLVRHKPGFRGGRFRLPPGLLDGHRVDLLLKRLTLPVVGVREFDRLPIPFRAVAADIESGEPIVLDHGDLALAMRASMSIPGAFAPREIDGRLLVDGGIVNNFPIDVVRAMGAEIVIAVDISTPPAGRDELASVAAIAEQLATLFGEQDKRRQIATLGDSDVFIRPDLGSIQVSSFDRVAEAVPAGEQATRAHAAELQRLSLPPAEYERHLAARRARRGDVPVPVISAVRLHDDSRLSDAVLERRLDVPLGRPLDVDRLEAGLDQAYGLELFESVYYDVEARPDGNVLALSARARSWGPDYLQGGVAVFEDFEGPNFNVALAYSRTVVDPLNAEWLLGVQVGREPGAWTEFYQPLDLGLRHFVDLDLVAMEHALNVFDDAGHKRAEWGVTRFGGTFAVGREIGTWAELRTGIVREAGRYRVQIGDPATPGWRYDTGEWFAQGYLDRLDEVAFPHRGASLRVRVSLGRDALGSATDYEQASCEATTAATRGRWTGVAGGLLGLTRNADAPLERQYSLGGLGRLSGLEQDERTGQQALLLRVLGYRRLANLQVLPILAGGGLEYGDVFRERSAVGLRHGTFAGHAFLGLDTPLGPLCLAYGLAERGRGNYYFTLGQPLGSRPASLGVR